MQKVPFKLTQSHTRAVLLLEQNNINNINQLDNQLIKHYNNLKQRNNDRKGGALSNDLNKHLQALYNMD